MTTKKKDLEIVCNLQWKNKPTNAGDKSNIVGIYDIPATTLNWDIFKSYLVSFLYDLCQYVNVFN